MNAPLRVDVLKLALDSDLAAVGETELGGPGVKAHLSNFQTNEEVQFLGWRKRMHLPKMRHAMVCRNVR